jgi:hypothetical protein
MTQRGLGKNIRVPYLLASCCLENKGDYFSSTSVLFIYAPAMSAHNVLVHFLQNKHIWTQTFIIPFFGDISAKVSTVSNNRKDYSALKLKLLHLQSFSYFCSLK